jgi:RND family efflux transporter MFP subunit
LLVAGLTVGGFLVGRSRGARIRPVTKPETAETASLIETAPPTRREFRVTARWFGRVESRYRVPVSALVDGRIEAIRAEDQAAVEQGARLFDLGGPGIEAERARLAGAVSGLEKRLEAARGLVDIRRRALARHLSTETDVATVQRAVVDLEVELAAAKRAVAAFETRVFVTAPVSGVFTKRRASVGEDVRGGEALAEVVDPAHVRVVARSFTAGTGPRAGQDAVVRLPDGHRIAGRVTRVPPTAAEDGATVVWIEGPDLDRSLRPGETVDGTIVLARHPDALAVPRSAVVYDLDERPWVFVDTGQGYERKVVTLGVIRAETVEVLSGIDGTEPVVTQGAYELYYRDFDRSYRPKD